MRIGLVLFMVCVCHAKSLSTLQATDVVEVFVNGKQCVAVRLYPGREDSLGVSLRAQGRDATLKSLDAWQMGSIYP